MNNRPDRILFVDDDRSSLDGLEAILRRGGHRWDTSFAIGGAQALEALERESFDVVVSAVEMPYVDGIAVLKHTLATNPEAIRIALSTDTAEDLALRAGLHAHQSLPKPCEPKELLATLRRAFEIRAIVSDPEMRAMLGSLRDLPAIPRTYQRLMSVLEDPRSSMVDLSRIVEGDVAATAKILHLVNSAFFGFGRPVRTILQAVQLLGVDLVASLVLSAGIYTPRSPDVARACEEVQIHSVQTAHIASSIASPALRRDTFTAGVLHDIGWLVQLNCGAPSAVARSIGRRFATADSEPEEPLHASLGAYLLGLWGLPLDIIDAVATHHHPADADARCTPLASNIRRAERALRQAHAEKSPSVRERAIALATSARDEPSADVSIRRSA